MQLLAIILSAVVIVILVADLIVSFHKDTIKLWVEDERCLPVRGHEEDAGLDLKSPVSVVIPAGQSVAIDTKTHIEIPKGYFGKLESKSGLNVKHGVVSLGGTIDAGYRGSIVAKLYNMGSEEYKITSGDKIVQLIIQPCMLPRLDYVNETEWNKTHTSRGNKGFGSTGK